MKVILSICKEHNKKQKTKKKQKKKQKQNRLQADIIQTM